MSAIPPISAASIAPPALPVDLSVQQGADQRPSFASILTQGMHEMESKVARADDLVRRFAVDDSIPVHQVTYALEEARLSVELAMQVRSRMVEAYRDLMNMQL